MRVLRPQGKILFLCGNATRLIKCMDQIKISVDYKGVFPVNVGGIVAWVVLLELRDKDGWGGVANHRERVRKLVHNRNKHKKK